MSRTEDEPRRLTEVLDEHVTKGSVLVMDALGRLDAAVFGGRAAYTAQRAGSVATVINGGSRDIAEIDELGYVVHAIGRVLPASEGKYYGLEVNGDLVIEGVRISPGDWIIGDESGICVVPHEIAPRVLALAEEREALDKKGMRDLRAGKTLTETHSHFEDDDMAHMRKTQ